MSSSLRVISVLTFAALAFALAPACSGGGSGGNGGGSSATGGGSSATGGGSSATGGGSSATGGGSPATGGGSSAAGGGSAATGGGSGGTGGGSAATGGGSSATGGGSSATGGGSQTDAGSDPMYTMQPGQCFTFATATLGSNNGQDCGDWLGLSGENVDLSGIGSNLCLLTGTYTSLSDVPTSYASCSWISYIEGINGLTNTGIIVRDAPTMNHHYRVRVITNSPSLVFNFSTID